VKARTDAAFAEYVAASMTSLRRLAFMLCHDWHRADDLVQATVTRLYVRWARAATADSLDAYVRTILFREFLHEARSSWARRVHLTGEVPVTAAAVPDREAAMDLQTAIADLPPRQRAALVLRFYCDLNVEQSAQLLGCSQGTVKSQTARALTTLRRNLEAANLAGDPPAAPGVPGPTKLYIHWDKAAAADNINAYTRAILVREFVHEQRASWAKRVTLIERPPETAAPAADRESALDVRAAVSALPPRPRAGPDPARWTTRPIG
jgi:RNA polymerase sigma-70 factor (sigma-E family)